MSRLTGERAHRAAFALLACALLPCCPAAFGLPASGSAPASAPLALDVLQTMRTRGCEGHPGSALPLRRPPTLQAAAGRWAGGEPLEVAIEDAGYRAERSQALQFRGSAAGLRSALLQRLCDTVTQGAYRDMGIWAEGQEVWILLAVPFAAPADAGAVTQELLERINAARARTRRCGARTYPPAPPLRLDARLNRAAERHAHDMLAHDFFEHRGSDGSTPATRVRAAGYDFALVGENIALGAENAAQAVQGWLGSPGHCANIMDAGYRRTGFAFAVNRRGAPRIYWVEDFAAP